MKNAPVPYAKRDQLPAKSDKKNSSGFLGKLKQFAHDAIAPIPDDDQIDTGKSLRVVPKEKTVITPKPIKKTAGKLVQAARDVVTPIPSAPADENRSAAVRDAWRVFQSGVGQLSRERQDRKIAEQQRRQREQLAAAEREQQYQLAESYSSSVASRTSRGVIEQTETRDYRITIAVGIKTYQREETRPDGTIIRERMDF